MKAIIAMLAALYFTVAIAPAVAEESGAGASNSHQSNNSNSIRKRNSD
jgi:hypothetical protein